MDELQAGIEQPLAVLPQFSVLLHPKLPEFLSKLLYLHCITAQAFSVDAAFVQQGVVQAKLQGFKRLQPAGQAEV